MSNRSAGKVSPTLQALSRWAVSHWATRLARRASNDAIQEAVLALLERESTGQLAFDRSGSVDSLERRLGGYLSRSALRAQARERARSRRVLCESEAGAHEESPEPSPERLVDARRRLEQLPCTAEEVHLLASDELSIETDTQQAERQGLTLNTLQARRSRVRKRLGVKGSAGASRLGAAPVHSRG